MKKSIIAATVLALMASTANAGIVPSGEWLLPPATVLATATGANADAFGECAAKIAAAKIAAENGLSPESESSLIWEAMILSTERTMTKLGESLKKLRDQGMEYSEIEDEMLQAGGDPDVLRIAGLCQHLL